MPNSQPNIHDADEARYDTLISIIDSIKNEADMDSDIYASAIQSLYWPEINVLRQEQITQEIREAIKEITSYNWADERRDFEQMVFEQEEKPEEEWHIFQRLVRLDNFLNGTSYTAEDHIG